MITTSNSIHTTIRKALHSSSNVVIASHIRPDGDAVGSLLGLGLSLQAAGKSVQMILADGVPSIFHFLPDSDKVMTRVNGPHDLSIILDCSDLPRMGRILDGEKPDLNIDHHKTNLYFARENLVDITASATAEIICEHIADWELPMTESAAKALLTGIISDTIGFRTSNVSPKTLQISADLMEKGVELADIYNRILVRRTVESVLYWERGLNNLQWNDRIVWTTLTLSDRSEAEYPGNDDADLVNLLSTINNYDIAVIFVEQKNAGVKVSWRAKPGIDVSQIALQFNGGGHPPAAGAEVAGDLETVQKLVLDATKEYIDYQREQSRQEIKYMYNNT